MKRPLSKTLFVLACVQLAACESLEYVTPAGGTNFAEIVNADAGSDIGRHFLNQPASRFPANIAVIRVQDYGYGEGRYKTITTRDIERPDHYESISGLPLIRSIVPLGRMLVPPNATTITDLRTPAAMLHADLLLIYSVDTVFTIEGKSLGPLSAITLGLIPNKKANVTATVAGALVDVRTGYVYGTTEATAKEEQRATVWSTREAIDASRRRAEEAAFGDFVDGFLKLWKGVVDVHAASALPAPPTNAGIQNPADRDTHHRIRLTD